MAGIVEKADFAFVSQELKLLPYFGFNMFIFWFEILKNFKFIIK